LEGVVEEEKERWVLRFKDGKGGNVVAWGRVTSQALI
jgi:hypothetical protein